MYFIPVLIIISISSAFRVVMVVALDGTGLVLYRLRGKNKR
jgi:hypothetical protein